MKLKKLLSVAALLASALGINAQTDVTDTHLVNADFSQGEPLTSQYLYGYSKDGTPNSFQEIVGWSKVVLSYDKKETDGYAGGTFAYGSNTALKGNNQKAPATNPNGEASGNCLGFFAVWGSGGYYYQDVTLPAGSYTITIPVYNASGTQNNTSYIGFIPEAGSSYTVATNPTVGKWTTQTINFELAKETNGKIALGYKSTGKGSGDNNHLFFDCVKIEYEEANLSAFWAECKTAASTALANPEYANVSGSEKTALESEVAKAEPTNNAGYSDAITALQNATNAFTAAKASYDAYVTACAEGVNYTSAEWPYASEAKQTALTTALNATAPTTATEASEMTDAIVTAYRQFVESNGKAEGVSGAVDYTSSMKGTDASVSASGWTGFSGTNQGQSYNDGNGNTTNKYFDGGWKSDAGVNITATQNITLPSGRYLMQITARSATNMDTYTLGVGEESVDLPMDGNVGGTFGNGWSDRYLVFESDGTELTVKITAKSTATQQWISFNRIRLVQLEVIEIPNATDDEYAALESAIATAESKILGFDEGEYAPYNNVAALQALAAAKAIDTDVDNTSEVVNAATGALNSAVWTENAAEVSAINLAATYDAGNKDGDNRVFAPGWGKAGGDNAYNTRLIQGSSGNAGMDAVDGALGLFTKFGTDYGKESGYTMPLNENTVYKFSFKFGAWGENKNITSRFAIMDPNGNTIDITPSSFTYNQNSGLANENVNAWFDYVGVFTTTSAGDYVLTMTKDNNGEQRQIIMGNISLVKAPVAEANMTITEAGWATFVAPFEVEIPTGVTAYTVEGVKVDNYLNKAAIETGVIPANTPVLLEGEAMTATFYGQNTATQDTYGSVLVGNVSGVTKNVPNNGESFVLLKQDGNLGFYKVASDDITVGNNRCYLNVPSAGVKAFFFGGETTGINGITDDATVVERYNAAGMKVAAPVKGLNIVKLSNGKVQKVLVK